MKKLLLVSQSPRRQQLLHDAGIEFSVISNLELIEIPKPELSIDDQIKNLAHQKAKQVIQILSDNQLQRKVLLTADTMVVFNGEALGKPKSEADAIRMLSMLSGNTHSVKTAYCFVDIEQDEWLTGIETTGVCFRKLSESEIIDYVKTGEPMDKAGAYGIQGQAGKFVSEIDGSYSNVVGLPVNIVQQQMQQNGWNKIL